MSYLQIYQLLIKVVVVACYANVKMFLTLKAICLLEVIINIMMRHTTSWKQ